MRRLHRNIFIVLAVLMVASIYNYEELVFARPQSVHNWRQSDCASLVMNYYQQETPFWEPHIHGLISDEGTSAINAPSEFPLYYWGVAQLYKIFGPQESILRGLNTLIFLLGICALIESLYLLSSQLLWSILVGLLIFTSPVLVYYGNNFLSNAPAFGMALIALYHFVKFLKLRKQASWWWAVLFFFLAGSFKVTGLFLFFSIGGLVLLSVFMNAFRIKRLNFFIFCSSVLLVISPLLVWIWHARFLNHLHQTSYFSTTTFPIWNYTTEESFNMIKQMFDNWRYQTFHPVTTSLLMVMLFYIAVNFKKIRFIFRWLILIMLIGFGFYFVFQFYTFVDHDYYTINMYILVALIQLAITDHLYYFKRSVLNSYLSHLFLLLFLSGNILYARSQHIWRYNDYPNNYKFENAGLYDDVENWLKFSGVGIDDTVIYLPDGSHTALYLMNRYGWTSHKMQFKDYDTALVFNQNEAQIRKSIENGAEFLIINGTERLYEMEYTHPFQNHLTSRKGNLFLFDLKHPQNNFERPERELLQDLHFTFEEEDSVYQIKTDNLLPGEGKSGSAFFMGPEQQYALDLKFKNMEEGQILEVRVWRKSLDNAKALPIIQSEETGLAFIQEEKVLKEEGDWQLLEQKLKISQETALHGVKVFFWKPGGGEVYFDEMSIRHFGKNPLEK